MRRNRFDRLADHTARRFSRELERMCADLHEDDAPSTAFECVLIELKRRQPHLMARLVLGMSNLLAEMERRTERAAPTQTADGMTIH